MTSGSYSDPVCGMLVTPDEGLTLVYEGVTLHFCSEACLREFQRHPQAYLDVPGQGAPANAAVKGASTR